MEWVMRGLVILPNGDDVLGTGPLLLKLREEDDVVFKCCEEVCLDRSLLPPLLFLDDEDDDDDDDDVEPTELTEESEESRSILPSGGRARR